MPAWLLAVNLLLLLSLLAYELRRKAKSREPTPGEQPTSPAPDSKSEDAATPAPPANGEEER